MEIEWGKVVSFKKKNFLIPVSGAHGACSLWFPFEKCEAAYTSLCLLVCVDEGVYCVAGLAQLTWSPT